MKAVISGLPFLSMPARQIMGVLDGCFAHLSVDGAYYQFTYGARCPVPRLILERLGLKAIRIGRTFSNFPPAAVYRIKRRLDAPAACRRLAAAAVVGPAAVSRGHRRRP